MATMTPDDRFRAVLEQLETTLAAGDIGGAVRLFEEDGYWRDLVTFTWNLRW
jgi:putative flavoprotein involved in K+ transport